MITSTIFQSEQLLKKPDIINEVRRKAIHELTKEEHQFKSIDCILHPHNYPAGFKPFPRYDLHLKKARLLSIIEAPKKLQLAMGYLKNDVELQAHYIVNKYYEREDDNFDEFDAKLFSHEVKALYGKDDHSNNTDCSNIPVLDMKDAGVNLHQLEELNRMFDGDTSTKDNHQISSLIQDLTTKMVNDDDKCRHDDGRKGDINFANVQELLNHQTKTIADYNPFILMSDNIEIFKTKSSQINRNKHFCQQFIIKEDETKRRKAASLTICVVFHGEFVNEEYSPAHLSASLHIIHDDGMSSSVGTAPYELQMINTNKKLGRIIIKYDFEEGHHQSKSTKFALYVCAMSPSYYSIEASCNALYYHAHDLLLDLLWEYLETKCQIKKLEKNMVYQSLDSRIAAIKISLLTEMLQIAETKRLQYEKDIDSLEIQQLECDSDTYFKTIVEKIKKSEVSFAKQCRLISMRNQSIQQTKDCISHIIVDQRKQKDLSAQMHQQNDDALEILTLAFCKLFGSQMKYHMIKNAIKTSSPVAIDSIECDESNETVKVNNRCRDLLKEIDRVKDHDDTLVASFLLHDMPQLFPKKVLINYLESEIKNLLLDHIKNEESNHQLCNNVGTAEEDSDSANTLDSESFTSNDETEHNDKMTKDIQSDRESDEPHLNVLPCEVCGVFPCHWLETNNEQLLLKEKQNTMSTKLIQLKQQRVRLLCQNPDEVTHLLNSIEDEIRSSSSELFKTEDLLKLSAISHELHNIMLNNTSKYVVVQSLHGYNTIMYKDEAIYALTAEEDRLVATLVAQELLDYILDSMMKGWIFGIPQINKEVSADDIGVTTTMHEIVSTNPSNTSATMTVDCIHHHALKRTHYKHRQTQSKRALQHLNRAEKSIKVGFAYFVLKYFQVFNILTVERHRWLPSNINGGRSTIKDRAETEKEVKHSAEKLKMIEEERNAKSRRRLIADAYEKAKHGYERIIKERKRTEKEKIFNVHFHHRKATLERVCAITIQRHYRGHLGRKEAKRWSESKKSVNAKSLLNHLSALTISRVYRGYCGRKTADLLRKDLALFILSLREKEFGLENEDKQDWLFLRKMLQKI